MVFLYIAIGLGSFVGAFVLYLFVVAVVPGFPAPRYDLQPSGPPPDDRAFDHELLRTVVTFEVGGASIHSWLYMPEERSGPVPCVIMAHGAGGTKEAGLERYAARFREAGLAVLVFDYRFFGDSGGKPRQLIWIPHQLADWSAAIDYARGLEEIDSERIGLWGTSFSGGHVVVLAARDPRIACVSAQCPGLDGMAAAREAFEREGFRNLFRMLVHAQRDIARSWLHLSPHRIPLVGEPGRIGLMTSSDAVALFPKIAHEGFVNEVCARIVIRGDKYRPIQHAANVRCPVLLQICDKDILTSVRAAEMTGEILKNRATVIHYPIGHFDIYLGDDFEEAVAAQLAFFEQHLESSVGSMA